MDKEFHFTVTDVARLWGKSPVTLRGWERQGLITFPRDSGNDRKLTCKELEEATDRALELKRIPGWRAQLVYGVIGALTFIEIINRRKK